MLELKDISYTIQKDDEDIDLIHKASMTVKPGHFMAIVGPSGCGKTTLLKIIAGLYMETDGHIFWDGRDLSEEGDLEPSEIGYVPQFSIAFDHLTVEESVESAVRLRVKTRTRKQVHSLADRVIDDTGLDALRNRPVRVLSGGQRRRLSLAMELVTDPVLLLCDEVTSGLDPKSEREIVRLMHNLSKQHNRIVINVTHSLSHLDLYDSILVLHEGKIVYHGQPRALDHYFSVSEAEEIYPRLAKRTSGEWHSSWQKHQADYYGALNAATSKTEEKPETAEGIDEDLPTSAVTPGFLAQFFALFFRRWKIFFRDSGQLILQAAILLGFPVLVVIFALDGIESVKRLADTIADNPLEEAANQAEIFRNHLKVGGLVSGLVMFQVILLTLMGSNNSAREIASERQIFEKEKLGGLRPSSYLCSKFAFLAVLVVVQSVWMAIFVQNICHIPTKSFGIPLTLLILVNAAMTSICLGISSMAKTPEQSSLLSVYLVGFQLPLSGAVLALPPFAAWLTRPFISAYWSWSGVMTDLESGFLNAVKKVTETPLTQAWICILVLLLHVAAGAFFSYIGVRKNRWE